MHAIIPLAMMPLAAVLSATEAEADPATPMRVYIGTYAQGIYLLEFDPADGSLESRGRAGDVEAPSFLAEHPSKPLLYSVGEMDQPEGTVRAWRIDGSTGMLTLINEQSSRGIAPCHIAVAPSEQHVAVANYVTGNALLLPIREDGGLDEPSDIVQHDGSGPNAARQEGPHAHSVTFDPEGERLLVADLGIDQIRIYQYDAGEGTLAPHDQPYVDLPPGAGPRHVAIHPTGEWVYVVNELDSTVTTFAREPEAGTLQRQTTVPTLPEDFDGDSTTAEIRVHPSGKFLYASNRGHDSITVYSLETDPSAPVLVDHTSTEGQVPRNFNLDPTGAYLLAANQGSDTVVVFRINPDTGRLTPTGATADVPRPVCVHFHNP